MLPYRYWKEQLDKSDRDASNRLGLPPKPALSDEAVIRMLKGGVKAMIAELGRTDIPYGEVCRCGRRGGKRTAPADGGSIDGIATPRALSFSGDRSQKYRLMSGGQCAPQVVLMTRPPKSWTAAPLGQSDDPNSPHFDDQAIELVSRRKMKSTYFKDKAALLRDLESEKRLVYEPGAP